MHGANRDSDCFPHPQPPQPIPCRPLALNESLVLLSGCLQITTVKKKQRRKTATSRAIAHGVPFFRASLPRTVQLQKVTIRTPGNKTHGKNVCRADLVVGGKD